MFFLAYSSRVDAYFDKVTRGFMDVSKLKKRRDFVSKVIKTISLSAVDKLIVG